MPQAVKTFAVAYVLGFLGIGVYKNRKQIIDTATHVIQQATHVILSHGDYLIPHLDSMEEENTTLTNSKELTNKNEVVKRTDSIECGDVMKAPARSDKPSSNLNLLGQLESESLLNVLDNLMKDGKKTDGPSGKRSVQILHINSNSDHESEYALSLDSLDTQSSPPPSEKTNDLHEVQQVVKSLENLFEALGDTGNGTTYTVLNEQDDSLYTCVEYEVSVRFGNIRRNFRNYNSGFVICKYNSGELENAVNDNSSQKDQDLKDGDTLDISEEDISNDCNSITDYPGIATHLLDDQTAEEINKVKDATDTFQVSATDNIIYQARHAALGAGDVIPADIDTQSTIFSTTGIEDHQEPKTTGTDAELLVESPATENRAQSSTSDIKLPALPETCQLSRNSDDQVLARSPATADDLIEFSSTGSNQIIEQRSPHQSIRTLAELFESGLTKSETSSSNQQSRSVTLLSRSSTLSSVSINGESWDMAGLEQ